MAAVSDNLNSHLAPLRNVRVRLSLLAVMLAGEWIPISGIVRLGRGGDQVARFLVAFLLLFGVIAYKRLRKTIYEFTQELDLQPYGWGWLLAHLCALLAFFGLSLPGALRVVPGDVVITLWYACALAAILFAVLVFVPPSSVRKLLRLTGNAWVYATAGAIVVFVLVAEVGSSLWVSQGGAIATATFKLAQFLLGMVFPDVISDQAHMLLGTRQFAVTISQACSGIEGLGMMSVFSLLWLWICRREVRFPHALLLVPCGLILIWFSNALRIVALISIGNLGAPKVAVGGFHAQAGWIAFSTVTLGYAAVLQKLSWFSISARPREHSRTENPVATFLVPFLCILAAGIVASAASADFEWLYPLRFVAAIGALWLLRRHYASMDWSCSWTGPTVGVIVFVLWIAIAKVIRPSGEATMPATLASSSLALRTGWIVIRAIAAATTVPIAEELAFRGFLLRRLVSANFESVSLTAVTWPAILLSSIAFGVLHGEEWIAGTLAGVLFAIAARWKGKLADAVVAHAATNALLAVYVLVFQQWQLW